MLCDHQKAGFAWNAPETSQIWRSVVAGRPGCQGSRQDGGRMVEQGGIVVKRLKVDSTVDHKKKNVSLFPSTLCLTGTPCSPVPLLHRYEDAGFFVSNCTNTSSSQHTDTRTERLELADHSSRAQLSTVHFDAGPQAVHNVLLRQSSVCNHCAVQVSHNNTRVNTHHTNVNNPVPNYFR